MNPLPILLPFFSAAAVLMVLMSLVLSEGDPTRSPRTLPDGGLEFSFPERAFWGIYIFLGILGFIALSGVMAARHGSAGVVLTLCCVAFIVLLLWVLPGTIIVNAQGLEQRYWLRKPVTIAWAEVRSIFVNEKRREVTIRSLNGSKIQYSRQFPDRERLMDELQAHCPDRMPGAKRVTPPPPPRPVVPPPEAPTA
jgi:hypothetical protein